MKTKEILFWWISTCTVLFAAAIAFKFGLWTALWYADVTKISFLVMGLLVLVMGLIGYNLYKPASYREELAWFASDSFTTLGMIGTVIGFLILLGSAFAELNIDDKSTLQAVIVEMAIGMSTALTTTLTGLIASLITKLQLVVTHYESES